ncbi:MAG: DNA mismatch endonuclease Vsr [Acidobacteria bacterium]|nr:MAG: DNA mismatch endonuclease Vsr [Acidobacteriota bacterium]
MDVHTPAQRSRNMAAIKGRNTKPERIVARLLKDQAIRASRNSKKLSGKPDFLIEGRKLVIFVHGCFWHLHRCPYGRVVAKTNATFWKTKRAATARRDARQAREIRKAGFRVTVIWECQTKDPARLSRRLRRLLDS